MGETADVPQLEVLTIGHSNRSIDEFLALLKQNAVEVVADVRSQPHSKYVPHFDYANLKPAVEAAGLQYVFLGRELGGMPEAREFYDAEGHVVYSRIAASEPFRRGIARLLEGIRKYRVAIMCSEEDPANCHRRLLVGKVLMEQGVGVKHIRGDGRIQPEEELARLEQDGKMNQMELGFVARDEETWKSTQSVSRRKRPSSSSEH
jgi:uncharacterized protein (DUF488 family)